MTTHTYNSQHWRVATNADGTETRNLHDKHLLLWQTDDTNSPTAKHTHEPAEYGNLVSRRDESTNETVYYHYDALGSTAALTDQTQVTEDTYTYKAYGDTQHAGASEQPFQWVGELGYQYDHETNRHHLRRRDYDSHLAQFLSQDPPEGDTDPNRFSQVGWISPTKCGKGALAVALGRQCVSGTGLKILRARADQSGRP